METSLLFLAGGLAVFGVSRLTQRLGPLIRALSFILTAVAFGVILQAAMGPPLARIIPLPAEVFFIMCILAGLFLFAADHFRIFHKQGIQYFATLLLSFILTGLVYLVIIQVIRGNGFAISSQTRGAMLILLLLQSFLFFFGFAFPQRMLIQQQARKEALAALLKERSDES